jgi:hypothetical protein
MTTPSVGELLVANAREAEQRRILEMAQECKTLEELIEQLKKELLRK